MSNQLISKDCQKFDTCRCIAEILKEPDLLEWQKAENVVVFCENCKEGVKLN